MFCFTVRRSL